ncbi:MAG: hypothetical protein Phog2KO_38660 [Phototrophicaceae bacterium]
MFETQDSNNMPIEPINPDVHPSVLRFSIWDRAETIDVETNQIITIGRTAEDDTVTVDLSDYHGRLLGVSRRHAQIFLTATGVAIRDLDSSNGTKCNGKILESGKVYDLRHNDELQIGGLYVTVYFV